MNKFLVIAALAASAAAFCASSANAAGYLKIGDIKGETTEGRQHKPVVVTKEGAQDQEMIGHKHGSDQVQHNAATMGGPTVAAGDVTGDGMDSAEKGKARVRGGLNPADDVQASEDEEASSLPTGKRQHKPVSVTKPVDKAREQGHARPRGGLNPADEVEAQEDEQKIEKGHAHPRGGLDPADKVKNPDDEAGIGLLLPAVQK